MAAERIPPTSERFLRAIIAEDVLGLIGNTPLVRIRRLTGPGDATIFAKLEKYNPGGSIKDRVAKYMIEMAEREGRLTKGMTIIEPTSGNTGIALAMIGIAKGYRVKIVMPKSMSVERRIMMRAMGAELMLVEDEEWRGAAIELARELAEEKGYFMPNQFENCANILAHYETTGREILEQTDGRIDMLVAGIGTGGTIMGVGKRLKEFDPGIRVVGVEAYPGSRIQGLRNFSQSGYVPPILDASKLDEKVMINDEDAFRMTKELAEKEGLFVGPSSGAAMWVALQKAKELGEGKTIVVIFPDGGEKYLSMGIFG
ncbi:MAG: cysteine synthase family protein [Candidatus Bathyarchaeia archaeon]